MGLSPIATRRSSRTPPPGTSLARVHRLSSLRRWARRHWSWRFHITIGDTPESVDHLVAGLHRLTVRQSGTALPASDSRLRSSGSAIFSARPLLTPREAALGASRGVPLDQASGEVSAEIITPYPPGIPVIAPGDQITDTCIEYVQAAIRAGMYISGPVDQSLATVRIVTDTSR